MSDERHPASHRIPLPISHHSSPITHHFPMDFPSDRRYTSDHEWIMPAGDGTARVGITDYAQGELGDIVFVELKAVGTVLKAEESFGTVEAVKTVSELFAPAAGTIEAVNEALDAAPESVNQDPYGDGWMVTVRLDNAGDLDQLMTAEEYRSHVGV
jgi:glycine cleavage system H protein